MNEAHDSKELFHPSYGSRSATALVTAPKVAVHTVKPPKQASKAALQSGGIELPENFETFDEARKAGFMRLKTLKDTGRRIVGLYCSFVPTELIYAADAVPVSLCASSDEKIPEAETVLPKNLCPLIKASYGFALTDTCPFFYFSDFIVGETTCDGKRKMFELLNDIKETYVMQLPHARGQREEDFWRQEIILFKEKLERFYNITITEEDIRAAITLKNQERSAMKNYLELGSLVPCPLSGFEMSTQLDALGFSFDVRENIKNITAHTRELIEQWKLGKNAERRDAPRILVTGCPNSGVRDKIIKAVEEMGASIVAFDSCNGIREKVSLVDEDDPDVYRALARKYLGINCAVMSPNATRQTYLGEMIKTYQVDGVIEIILQACHPFNVESWEIKRYITEQCGLPYINIETDFSKSDTGQISTRLAAFLETMW